MYQWSSGQTSALAMQRSWVLIHPIDFPVSFVHRTQEKYQETVLNTHRCKGRLVDKTLKSVAVIAFRLSLRFPRHWQYSRETAGLLLSRSAVSWQPAASLGSSDLARAVFDRGHPNHNPNIMT